MGQLLALLLIPLLLIGCDSHEPAIDRSNFPEPSQGAEVMQVEGDPVPGGIFVLAQAQGPKTFHPMISEDVPTSSAINPIHAGLVEYDWQNLKHIPALAHSWDVSDDGLTYTFYLREGIRWSDGHPFDADDVIFSLDAIFDERYPNRASSFMSVDGQPIKYRKVDQYTVEFKTHVRYAPFFNMIGFIILPKHILGKSYEDGSLLKQWSLDTAIEHPEEIVGLGPFKIRRFLTGERLLYEPNPYYWRVDQKGQKLPYIDFMIHKYVPDANTQMVLFSTGQTDGQGLQPRDLSWVELTAKKHNFKIYDLGPEESTRFIWFNMKPEKVEEYKAKWFNDKRFRQAISHCINREGLIDAVGLGKGVPLYSIIGPANVKWHNPDVPKYPFSPEQATRVFKEIGFKYDAQGNLYDSEGNRVSFELMAPEGGSNTVVTTLQENLAQVGIDMRISFIDFGTMIERTNSTFEYEAAIMGFGGGNDEPNGGKDIILSTGRLHVWNPEQETPATPWEAELDELFIAQAQEMDESKRIEMIHEVQNILSEQLPLIYLYTLNQFTGINKQWQNLKIPPMGSLVWNIDEIWAKP